MKFLNLCLLISGIIALTNVGGDETLGTKKKLELVERLYKKKWITVPELARCAIHSILHSTDTYKNEKKNNALGVWRGNYMDEQNVATECIIKIFKDEETLKKRKEIFEALNAMEDGKIERYHIPRIYHIEYTSMAMTLFDGSLDDYFKGQGKKPFSDADILCILLQSIIGLEYLSTKKVVHNDIKPKTIFYKYIEGFGRKIFISGFKRATLNDECFVDRRPGHHEFNTKSFFAGEQRYAKDDLESLVYSLWYLAGVKKNKVDKTVCFVINPEGMTIRLNIEQCGEEFARKQLEKKLKHFKPKEVQDVFMTILNETVFSTKKIPNYDGIIQRVIAEMEKVSCNGSSWYVSIEKILSTHQEIVESGSRSAGRK